MAFIQIQSENPKFSFLIRKNPASGMLVKSLRKGLLFGYYSLNDQRQFNCWFKDADAQISYDTDKEFEFNDTTRYTSAVFVTNCLDEFFHEPLSKDLPDDTAGFQNEVLISAMRSQRKYFEIFNRCFSDFTVEYEPICASYFRVRIRTKQSLRKLLSFTAVLALINGIQNREIRIVDDHLILRYAKLIQYLDAPYFVRYVFKVNLVRSESVFKRVRELLDTDAIKMSFGYNFLQRLRFVERNIAGSTVIDYGCGEGRYFVLARKYEKYYALDRDETCLEKCRALIRKKQYDNITVLDTPEDLPVISERKTILLSEVLEHNTKEDAMNLLQSCMTPDTRILVTTPNRDFNVHYFYDAVAEEDDPEEPEENATEEQLRHDDHRFEFNDAEFRTFIQKAVEGKNAEVHFFSIGDQVDGASPQSAAIIDLKSESDNTPKINP